MKAKKIAALLCCASMLAAMVTGCGSTGGDTAAQEPEAAKTEEAAPAETAQAAEATTDTAASDVSGSITVWEHASSFEPALEAVVEGFNKKYPNVEVEYEIKEDSTYYSLLATAIQSGEAPDVFYTHGTSNSNMEDYVKNGVLMDLTDVIDYSALEEKSLQIATVNGRRYSVPWMTLDTRCAYYNKDIFAENGWSVPNTFDEFEELLVKQKEAGYTPISKCLTDVGGILFLYEPILAAMYPEYVNALENYSVKVTDQPAIDAYNKMLEWKDKGYFGDNVMGVSGDAAILAFTTGKAAMYVDGSWNVGTISGNNPELNYGAFQIPDNNGMRGMVGTYANGFSIYNDTEEAEAAKAFVQYCASLEAQTIWVKTLDGVSGSPKIEAGSEIVKEISNADTVYTSWQSVLVHNAKEGEPAATIWEEDVIKLFDGGITTEEMMNDIAAVMQ